MTLVFVSNRHSARIYYVSCVTDVIYARLSMLPTSTSFHKPTLKAFQNRRRRPFFHQWLPPIWKEVLVEVCNWDSPLTVSIVVVCCTQMQFDREDIVIFFILSSLSRVETVEDRIVVASSLLSFTSTFEFPMCSFISSPLSHTTRPKLKLWSHCLPSRDLLVSSLEFYFWLIPLNLL